MSDAAIDEGLLAPERFFAHAATRLSAVAPAPGLRGDHVLNPDFMVGGTAFRDAAVLIPVMARAPAVSVLLTLRTAHLAVHAGQIAFPGGKIEATDAGAAAAALREAQEEIGLDPAAVEVVGYLDPYLTGTGYRILPVLGRVTPDAALELNREEVEDAFEVPLAFLMSPANHLRASRMLKGRERHFYEMPFEGRYIWGITAGIIRGLYERVFA